MALAHSTDESMGRETLPPNDEEELSPSSLSGTKTMSTPFSLLTDGRSLPPSAVRLVTCIWF